MIESGEIEACKEQKLLAAYVRKCFEREDIYTDEKQLENYLGLSKYLAFEQLFEWEKFCIALHLCTYWTQTKRPRWPDLLLLLGRGAGKDGYISLEALALSSPYNGIGEYDIDICANTEEQAMRPVSDVINALDHPKNSEKLRKFYKWTKEQVVSLKTGAIIRGRTNNPKSKDGMRSGIVIFNEIHQYENYNNIKVFVTGLGKRKHPRILYATTNGDVREGPLDELIERSGRILSGQIEDNGLLPFICRLDNKDDAKNPAMWEKANPSLPHMPDLRDTIHKEFANWTENPAANADFMTKRMNLPQSDAAVMVTDYENVKATNRALPDLTGWRCVAGIDYASIGDMASVNLHFRKGQERYDINHSWLCLESKDLPRIHAPWREWAQEKLLSLVDDVEIHPDLLCEWIATQAAKYHIELISIDNFRYALVAASLRKIGFDVKEYKNVRLVRPSDIMKVQPVIDSAFKQNQLVWGNNPVLRWAVNNTKLIRSNKTTSDTGNQYYAKIEGRSRKTDPFMAFVAAMIAEDILPDEACAYYDLPVIVGR